MSYRLKCKDCGHTYIATRRYSECPRHSCRSRETDLLEEVLTIAAGVAIGSIAADAVTSVVGSLFDW